MPTETTASSSGRFTFLILLLILAGIVGLIVIDGNAKRAMAPDLSPQDSFPYWDDDVLAIELSDEVTVIASVVASDSARMQGLSGTEQLARHEGLFFVFPRSDSYGIWMKDMNYSIDIIWINDAFRVVYIAPNVAPETYPEVFRSEEPARYVLEVSAGIVEEAGLRVGDSVAVSENVTAFDLYDAEREVADREGASTDDTEPIITQEDHE